MSGSETPTDMPGLSRLATGFAMLAIAILLCNVALVCYDVLIRWLANRPQSWVSDVAELTYPLAIVCCFPPAVETGSMIVIRAFSILPFKRLTWLLDCIGQLALAAILAFFAWKVFWRALADLNAGFATSLMRIPTGPTWLAVAAILALACLLQLRRSWELALGQLDHA
jgi:TRAP-type C4-dicarboxylate transport system permease small subunit